MADKPLTAHDAVDIIMATISPYNPIASAKMRIRIIPTKTPSAG